MYELFSRCLCYLLIIQLKLSWPRQYQISLLHTIILPDDLYLVPGSLIIEFEPVDPMYY